jgi:hypothetical protein
MSQSRWGTQPGFPKPLRRALSALALASLLASCNLVSIDDYPCPTGGTTLTYKNFGQAFMIQYCNSCHSAPDGDRNGAPDDFVFDTQAEVQADAARIFARAADTNDSMPPGPNEIPDAQRVNLAIWLACGAK